LLETAPPAPAGKEPDPAVAAASAALRLAEQASSVGELAPLEQAVAANPDDHKARFDFAVALSAKGDRAGAADQLLEIIRRDRKWNDEAARKQLLQLFEAWGLMDPESIAARRKLSAVWF
jgi:putative thioredoxin